MLANSIFIIISLNQWSKILTRKLNQNLLHGKHNNIAKVHYKKELIECTRMSEESSKYNLIERPSTSGSNPNSWDCKCANTEKSNCRQHSGENKELISEENFSNLIITNPVMIMQGVTSTISSVGYCQSNVRFSEFSLPESLNKRFCQRYKIDEGGSRGGRNMGRKKDHELLDLRVWENATNGKRNTKPGFIFSLMSYNVLAQDLVEQHPYLYTKSSQESLAWRKRWHNLFSEIKRLSPDILCLQEVQESHIKEYYSLLEALGYRSLYKKRTGVRTDGCALYYKTELINLVEYTTVEYYQPNMSILNRDNVGIIAKFVPKLYPTREFVIATTHLLYNPKRQDVRLAQMQVLLAEVERISYNTNSRNGGCYLPVIITGDLNSTPDSPIYDFVTEGMLNYEYLSPRSLIRGTQMFTGKVLVPPELRITDNCQHADLLQKRLTNEKLTRLEEISVIELFNSGNRISSQYKRKEINPDLFCTGILSHNFAFKSAYNHGKRENSEGTTFQYGWLTVDYIFYSIRKDDSHSEDKLKLLSRYRLPTKNELSNVRIPNNVFGSDHLSLMAKFKLEY